MRVIAHQLLLTYNPASILDRQILEMLRLLSPCPDLQVPFHAKRGRSTYLSAMPMGVRYWKPMCIG
jgi:hypothetical protein